MTSRAMGDKTMCARCGHVMSRHGRRGHGACRHRSTTEHGQRTLAELEPKLAGLAPEVRGVVIGAALCLPGMTVACECKRFAKGRQQRDD